MSGAFPDGTTFYAEANGDSITVVAGGVCTGTYTVTSGEVLGVKADDSLEAGDSPEAGDSSAASHIFGTLLPLMVALLFLA